MVSLWDLLSLLVGCAAAGGGCAAVSIYRGSGLREIVALVIVAGIAIASVPAVRAVGHLVVKRAGASPSRRRFVAPYAVELRGHA